MQKPLERDICNIIQQPSFDWPNSLINMIEMVLSMPCTTPKYPEFKFEISAKAALHNLNILGKYYYNLDKALKAQQDSLLGYGKEFKPPKVIKAIFRFHPLWQHGSHPHKWKQMVIS